MAVERTQLVAMLQAIQARDHYLAPEALRRVAEELGLSLAAVVGVATFYSQFRLRPAGAHTVRVCVGTACHVKGAETVYAAFRRELGIEGEDDTDAARRFTVEKVACIGCCMLAPAVQIDAVTYGPVEPASVGEVLRDFLARRTERDGRRTRRRVEGLPRGEVRVCCCSSCSAAGDCQSPPGGAGSASGAAACACAPLLSSWRSRRNTLRSRSGPEPSSIGQYPSSAAEATTAGGSAAP